MIEDRWADEAAWWTMGAAEARRRMHPAAVMAFPGGLMQGEAILAALGGAPRWAEVEMTERASVEGEDCLVLAYRVRARRAAGPAWEAFCTSTWVRQEDGWRLIQHQQTPPDPAPPQDEGTGG